MIYRKNKFKGDFNQGMMSGKGKYIWSNGISYEGDFLNNEIVGTGIYRWTNEKYFLFSAFIIRINLFYLFLF